MSFISSFFWKRNFSWKFSLHHKAFLPFQKCYWCFCINAAFISTVSTCQVFQSVYHRYACTLWCVLLYMIYILMHYITFGTSDFDAQMSGIGKFSIGKLVFWLKLFLSALLKKVTCIFLKSVWKADFFEPHSTYSKILLKRTMDLFGNLIKKSKMEETAQYF